MEGFSLLQRRAFRQLFRSRPVLQQSFRQIQSSAQPAFRTGPLQQPKTFTRSMHARRLQTRRLLNHFQSRSPKIRRFNSTSTTAPSEQNLSISQKMKKLSREYGWSAVGVYLLLSALDFPFCFLAVKLLGTDRIGHWEHVVVSYIKGIVTWPLGESATDEVESATQQVEGAVIEGPPFKDGEKRILDDDATFSIADHGYKDAEQANSGDNASLWTQLALAYAIHKSFIFVRVPLTAAVLPKVVKTLRSWGWNIGKRPVRKTVGRPGSVGVNTKGTGVKPDT